MRFQVDVSSIGRRMISVPAVFIAATLATLATPWVLPVLALRDALIDRRLPYCRAWVWLVGVLFAEVLGVTFALIQLGSRDRIGASYRLQRGWARALVDWTAWVYRLRLVHEGPSLESGPFVMLPRHASLADTLLPMWVTDGERPLLPRYVLKEQLRWDPCLDLVGHQLPNAFVARSGAEGEIDRVAALADDLGADDFVVIFPEGTRFSEARRDQLIQRFRSRGELERVEAAERLRNVLPLRPGGTVGLLARRPLDVVLVAHTGLEGTRRLGDVLRGDLIGRTIRVQTLRIDGRLLPRGEGALRAWLEDAWTWMDRAVGSIRDAA